MATADNKSGKATTGSERKELGMRELLRHVKALKKAHRVITDLPKIPAFTQCATALLDEIRKTKELAKKMVEKELDEA